MKIIIQTDEKQRLNVHIRGKLYVIHSTLEDLLEIHRKNLPVGVASILDRAEGEIRTAYIKMLAAEEGVYIEQSSVG